MNDSRSISTVFTKGKEKELEGLIENETWKAISKEVSSDANVLNERFVLSIKKKSTGNNVYKVRFVVQGHKDRAMDYLVHESYLVKHRSEIDLKSIISIFIFETWSRVVT